MTYQEFWQEPEPQTRVLHITAEVMLAAVQKQQGNALHPAADRVGSDDTRVMSDRSDESDLSDARNTCSRDDALSPRRFEIAQVLTAERIVALADRAAENPLWWKANRLHFFCPDLTYAEIAGIIGCKTASVRDYIKRVEIPESAYENLPEIQ